MHSFRDQGFSCSGESVDLGAVADRYGTPIAVYRASTISDRVTRLQRSMSKLDAQRCDAMKASRSLALLKHFANLGRDLISGVEVNFDGCWRPGLT